MIRDELGSGGMAVVYRAEDTTLRREVAIKVLIPQLVRRGELSGRFLREARAAAALDHPGIMKIFDVGGGEEGSGTPPYIVMELLRGRSLKEFLERSGAPLGELAAMIGAVLAEALHAAHQAGVIHRDVKPANVMITDDGRPVLCDFGVARLANDDAVATQSGLVLGTPVFMAPEQALAHEVDARTDVYSLGAALYQIATGALPFAGTTAAVISAVMRGEFLPPARRNPALGSALGREIMKAMAKAPDARHASAADFGLALTAIGRVPGLGERTEELRAYFAAPAEWNARARPLILDAAMTRARTATKRREFARALAECDRVLALDPQHDGASQLADRIGQGTRRSKRVAIVGAALLGFGALGAGGAWLFSGASRPRAAVAAEEAGAGDADARGAGGAGGAGGVADAAAAVGGPLVADVAVGAGAADGAADAGARAGPRAGRPGRSDGGAGVGANAALAAPDAAPAVAVVQPPPRVEPARLIVKIGPYCDITIDGTSHGRSPRAAAIELPPGKHVLVCAQDATGRSVRRDLELAPGEELLVMDTLVPQVIVTIDVRAGAVRIDGLRHAQGVRVKLTTGRHRVELADGEGFGEPANLDIPSSPCTLRDRPELSCR